MSKKLSKDFTEKITYIRKHGELINIGEHLGWIVISYGDKLDGMAHRLMVAFHPAIMGYVNMRLKPVMPPFGRRVEYTRKYNVKAGYVETKMKVTVG